MLTPDYLARMTDAIAALYEELSTSIVTDIARRIVRMGAVSESGVYQTEILQEAGVVFEDVMRRISEHTPQSDRELSRMFRDAATDSLSYDDEIYRAAGLEPIPIPIAQSPAMLQRLTAGLVKTQGDLRNLTLTTAVTSQSAYIDAVNLAYAQISSGAMSYTQAITRAVASIAATGTHVRYPTGHRDRIDVAIRRAALTGVAQTVGTLQLMRAEDMGCDAMEITAHFGARPTHADWQGQIVSLSGRSGYLSQSDIGYGSGDGFKGWNCRHDWYPYFEGISSHANSDAELRDMRDRTVTYNGKEYPQYDASQLQRRYEREVRESKRQLAALDTAAKATGDPALQAELRAQFDATAVTLKRRESRLDVFSGDTGLRRQRDREQVYGFGRSQSSRAVWANRRAADKTQ